MKGVRIQSNPENDICQKIFGWIETDQMEKVYQELKQHEGTMHQTVNGKSMIHVAVEADKEGLVKYLLAHLANPVRQDAEGNTALHLAFKHGAYAIVYEIILSQKPEQRTKMMNEENKKKETPLMMAAKV